MKFNIRFSGEMNIKVKDIFHLERKLTELSEDGASFKDINIWPEEEEKPVEIPVFDPLPVESLNHELFPENMYYPDLEI